MTWATARRLATVSVLVGLVAGCAGGGSAPIAGSTQSSAGADHACVTAGGSAPRVAWSQLRNPILSYANAAVKDQALVWDAGRWHMVFSYVTNDSPVSGQEHWGIATAESTDMVHWSAPMPWSDQPGGMASPDVVRAPGGDFVATYDSPPGEAGPTEAKLYYRTSPDLVHWSSPHRLAPGLHSAPGTRLIDPALAWTSDGVVLAYKVGTTAQAQAFELAWSKSGSLSGQWSVIGQPTIKAYGDTFENYELLTVGGHWHLVATSNSFDQPWIFTLRGDPALALELAAVGRRSRAERAGRVVEHRDRRQQCRLRACELRLSL